ncbi:MAG TPA: OmpA family protein [Burkholderiales bacterium]|nr:OmpA family protein [Burkholderiales bacterium]
MTKTSLCSTAFLAAALCIPETLMAQGQTSGYLMTPSSTVPVVKWAGGCVRASYWSPAMATSECDPDLVPRPAAAPAPAPAPAPRAAPTPPPAPVVKPAPVPAPVAKPAARKPVQRSVTLTDYFASNSATLTPAARAGIDKEVVEPMRGMSSISLIYIEGHTDRIGSPQANQRLSERRAEAVANYLVSKGADRSKIETLGLGKTNPVKSCPDQKDRKKLAECLAPNRRVVVQVTGMPR